MAGFNNDFDIALSLLIPQFEHSLRKILETREVTVWKIDAKSQLHSEESLNSILGSEEAAEFLGEDLQFELQGLLTERVGHNFRNEFAHGLMQDAAFCSSPAVYLWWLFFHLVVHLTPLLNQIEISKDKETTEN